ncbi:uncharacterized protein LOC117645586 [Thrips palmi]|uniref:Uncharacterized protein LOC117645586 n=1 Tax=Thrips palmi TaxID=161013 RepID=A0A6P8YW86_THRPL|nr:uncharacterized protein LOC117645586 [Thrips palmi]
MRIRAAPRTAWLLLAAGLVLLLVTPILGALKPPSLKTTTTTTTTTTPKPEEEPTTTPAPSNKSSLLTGVPQVDYKHDPNLPRELNGADLRDYPFYSTVPDNITFPCEGLKDGFYASIEHKCQVYHHCLFGTRYDFLCANYTAFDQRTFICHFVSEVDCKNSPKWYSRNEPLYKATTTTTLAPPPLPARAIYDRLPPSAEGGPRRGAAGGAGGGRRRRPYRRRRPVYEYYYDDEEYDDQEYYDDEPSAPSSTTPAPPRSSRRPFLPSRGGNPVLPRGLQPLGAKAKPPTTPAPQFAQIAQHQDEYDEVPVAPRPSQTRSQPARPVLDPTEVVEPVTYRAQVPLTALDGSNYRSRVAGSSVLSYSTTTTAKPAAPNAPNRYHIVKTTPPPTNHVDEYPKDDPEEYDDSLNDALHPPLAPLSSLAPHSLPYRQLRSHASKATRNGEQQVVPNAKILYEPQPQQHTQALTVVPAPSSPAHFKSRGNVHYQTSAAASQQHVARAQITQTPQTPAAAALSYDDYEDADRLEADFI